MDLYPYIGLYIKVITQDQEWFIGKLLKIKSLENVDSYEYEFNVISSSKDREIYKKILNNTDRGGEESIGNHILHANEIIEIEELDPKVQQGIKLTLTNVPDIRDAYHSMKNGNISKRIEFGIIEEPE